MYYQKLPPGIKAFAILFIILGVIQMLGSLLNYYTLLDLIFPRMDESFMIRQNDIEEHIEKNIGQVNESRKDEIYKDFDKVKHKIASFRNSYLSRGAIFLPAKSLIFLSFVLLILFIWTGTSFLNLKSTSQYSIFLSLVGMLIFCAIFFWNFFSPVAFITELSNEVIPLAYKIGGKHPPTQQGIIDTFKIMFSQSGGVITTILGFYIIVISASVYFFTLPEIKSTFINK